MTEQDRQRRHIVDIGKRLYQQGMIVAGEGNVSVRLDADRILVTPSGLCKGRLMENDMVLVDSSGDVQQTNARRPTSELDMHLCVYRMRPEVRACIHAHPVYATACSVAGISLSEPVLPEIVGALGEVATVPYATPSTPEVAGVISPVITHHDSIILKNHGVLTVGPDLETAFMRMEMTEHLAQIVYLARTLGRVEGLTSSQVLAIRRAAHDQH